MSEPTQESGAGAFLCTFGALPAVRLCAPSGARAMLTLFGAHLVSWQPRAGDERLFFSRRSSCDGTRAIRGGVPVIFPQFAERGPGLRHGFARLANWRLSNTRLDADSVFVECQLTQRDVSAQQAHSWPHRFALTLGLTLHAEQLDLSLAVENTGDSPFSFAAALHSYFRIDELERTTVTGLRAHRYSEQPGCQDERRDTAPVLALGGKLDRIYHEITGQLRLDEAGRSLRLQQSGFEDAVVWNPGAHDAQALSDLDDDEYRQFVCIEAAALAPPTLAPGAIWRASQQWQASGTPYAEPDQ
jgi:glucose-6-phosphate 1-epimerase